MDAVGQRSGAVRAIEAASAVDSGSSGWSTGRAPSRPRSGSATSGCRAAIEDFPALSVTGAILGGLFNSRLNMKLREEKGYTYGASAGWDLRRGAGPFAARAAVNGEATAPAIADLMAELDRIRESRVTDAELERRPRLPRRRVPDPLRDARCGPRRPRRPRRPRAAR